ncbi:MAG: LmeA family phospholipid-binding protein [Anaerolineales bacterium]
MMKIKIFLALIILTLATLACSIFVGGPDYPATAIPVSTQAVGSLHDQVNQATATGAATGTITLNITEEQLTSYLAVYLQSNPNLPITNPQVQLQNGQMELLGKVQQGMFSANVSMTMSVSVDQNGQPKITITQEDFGPLPAPQGLNDAISAFVAEALTGSLGPAATGFRLESISIANGTMTVTGRVK